MCRVWSPIGRELYDDLFANGVLERGLLLSSTVAKYMSRVDTLEIKESIKMDPLC